MSARVRTFLAAGVVGLALGVTGDLGLGFWWRLVVLLAVIVAYMWAIEGHRREAVQEHKRRFMTAFAAELRKGGIR